MADEPDNLILRMLRAMDIKLDTLAGKVDALHQHSLAIAESLLGLRKDIQNLEVRVARIEARSGLREQA